MIHEYEFAKQLRNGVITAEEGLEMLKANQVAVIGRLSKPTDPDWDDIEDAAIPSPTQFTLSLIDALHLSEAYSTEMARARQEGRVLNIEL